MRRLKKISFLFSLFSVLILSSCTDENTIKIEEEQFKKTYYLSSDSVGHLEVDLTMEFLVDYRDTVILHKIQNQICEKYFLTNCLPAKSKTDILTGYGDFLAKEYIDTNLSGFLAIKNSNDSSSLFLYDHEFSLKSFFYTELQHIISYGIDSYSYTGGAHGISSMIYSNYDLRTGSVISETDLFLEDTKEQITNLLIDQLIKQNEEIDNEDDLNQRFWIDKIEPNGNFYITKQGITYVYNPYEIAPYFMGLIEIDLPFYLLSKMIKKNSPVRDLL